MTTHLQPPPSETVQRYLFNSRMHRPSESIATYVAELHSTKCFGTAWFVILLMNVGNNAYCQRKSSCLRVPSKSLKPWKQLNAKLKICRGPVVYTNYERHRVTVPEYPNLTIKQPATVVEVHTHRICANSRTKNVTIATKKGHIAKVCRAKKRLQQDKRKPDIKGTHKLTEDEDAKEYAMYHCQTEGSNSMVVNLLVNKAELPMEVDTGATLSIISETTIEAYGQKTEPQPYKLQARN